MRFNEKELLCISKQPSEKAAELGMRGPKKGDGCCNCLMWDQSKAIVRLGSDVIKALYQSKKPWQLKD
ncbi:Pleckstrin homology domain-containing family J member 1 [Acipenser ruthenus]|uniref:Pleckstrin homology domain-containing family J member 1 n=1 Tax=Acipenser ruthenus TaxID=7906 RepID=A0A444V538_ACIRT|nr:Pleckstrin homology domain-containing family J member 1 [Acipenser ruthenus]